MTLFVLLAVVSASASTLIPVTFLPNPSMELPQVGGLPVVDAEYLHASLRAHVVHLGTVGYSVVADDEERTVSADMALRIPTLHNASMVRIDSMRQRTDSRINGVQVSTIGMGPGSDLLRVSGHVDFIRQSTIGGFLRLGGTEQDFIRSDCLPDSIMRMQTFLTEGFSTSRAPPRVETRFSVSIGDNAITTDSVFILDSAGFVLTLPHMWVASIYEALPRSLQQNRFRRTVFSDCANHLQRLPNITLTFSAGSLRLFPEDYTRSTGQDDTCELLIASTYMPQMIWFNPLMIPGINARVAENEITLCDSAINL